MLPILNNNPMLVKDIAGIIEAYAPLCYQEGYDNSGLQVGDPNQEVIGVLVTLDVTEAIIDEALSQGCNLIVAHHPLLFQGLKRITPTGYYTSRIVWKAIRNDIAIYAAHTNLDNIQQGVNAVIAQKLGVQNTRILRPANQVLYKLFTYAPVAVADQVRDALFAAGAGHIGKYAECSFNIPGTGTFRPQEGSTPAIGQAGGPREAVSEVKIEVLVAKDKKAAVLSALMQAHPYEDVAYEWIAIDNPHQEIGSGMIGDLNTPLSPSDFLKWVQKNMQTACIKYTSLPTKTISRVAFCGGSGSFLLEDAIRAGADVFITADFKYHQYFDADGKILILDIGHYESEQFTISLLASIIKEKKPNFAVILSKLSTNPVKYFS